MQNATIAIIGAGNMGASLLSGLIANHYLPEKLWVTDADPEKLAALKKQFHVHTTLNNDEAVKQADVVILAVKPQIMADVAQKLSVAVQAKKPLVISIAAGIREKTLQKWLGSNVAIVRTMPNMPALMNCGATALYRNTFVADTQKEIAEFILRAVGIIVWLEEEQQMDAVTALSGSGPAYFFLVIEALQKAGEALGLSRETARILTLQTALGAAKMALESNVEAEELRRRVTSPGGTTEQALKVLEENKLREIFQEALEAAKKRSEELAQVFN